ncbi:MAG: DNA polymerase IV [Clostridia bacterium]
MAERAILHCDCNCFFASVECLDNPALKDVCMAVAGDPKDRSGIILAKNELAKAYGVTTAETVWQAKKKCPELVLVPPRHARYLEISRQVNCLYERYTSQVEPFGIDESFLDVTGSLALFDTTPLDLANRIREQVKSEIGITISVGVSFNKIFAKLGSDMKKPDAVTQITRENFRERVWSLPVAALLFVGGATEATLKRQMILTIGDLARSDPERIAGVLGKSGLALWHYANGLDDDPVRTRAQREPLKSVGNGMTFRRDLIGERDIRAGVLALTDEVAFRMRKYDMKCRTVQVHIKSPALKTISRQITLSQPTLLQKELFTSAMALIKANWPMNAPIRALTITATGLIPARDAYEQMTLFDDAPAEARKRRQKLEDAVYRIRLKHGPASIAMGCAESPALGIHALGAEETGAEELGGAEAGNAVRREDL